MKKILSIQALVEFILVVFAIANTATISEYFLASHMNAVTSYSIGFLMGLILIASAMMLSRIERRAEIFKTVLISTVAAAVLAGVLQSLAYHEITKVWATSIVKGAGFPLVEVALAYSVSLFTSYQKQKEIELADERLDEQLAALQRDATNNLDPEKIKQEVADKMQQIISARINKFTNDQLAKYNAMPNDADARQTIATLETQLQVQQEVIASCNEERDKLLLTIASCNEEIAQCNETIIALQSQLQSKTPAKNNALQLIAQYLALHCNGIATESINNNEIAEALQINASTVFRNIKKLKDSGKLNGHVNATLLQ